MSRSVEIKDLEGLISEYIPQQANFKNYTIKPLLEPGENYGSLVFSVTVNLQDASQKPLELHLIVKMVPTNEWIKIQFNSPETFKHEIAMYNIISPALLDFQREQGSMEAQCFPKSYGTRKTLKPNFSKVDEDAVIALENLKISGFVTLDRMNGYNFETSKIVLKELACFHAVPVALKFVKPDRFREVILPHLTYVELFSAITADVTVQLHEKILATIQCRDECIPLIPKITKAFKLCEEYVKRKPLANEPFATMSHNDLWSNNIMIKFINNEPIQCKLLDFQTIDYRSPCEDLIFFLYTTVQQDVLDNHFETLISYYFEEFLSTLKDLKCDIKPFTYELFLKELEYAAKVQFLHIMVMLDIILGEKNTRKSVDEISDRDFISSNLDTEQKRKRMPEVVLHYFAKGWL